MAKITMSPAEIHAFADKVWRAFVEDNDGQARAFGSVTFSSKDALKVNLTDAVTVACGLDQIAAEVDLLTAAHDALEGVDEEGDLPPGAF